MIKEAILYEKLDQNRVRCYACNHRCIIPEGKRGECTARLNKDGKLYSLIYARISSICVDPIEKKPLFHFYPGTLILSLGSYGCNFRCPGCQNWGISHEQPTEKTKKSEILPIEEAINLLRRTRSKSIAWTYNEPSIWIEYTYELAKLARQEGFHTAYVTNGYASPEQLDLIGPYLEAYRVDVKGFSQSTYKKIARVGKLEYVLESAKRAKHKWNMHIECVTNVTPTINDDMSELRDLVRWIKYELGEDTPWHITRFYPHLDLINIDPTPVNTLERIWHMAREEGLRYPYLGNVAPHAWESTYCHGCKKVLIERSGFFVSKIDIVEEKCKHCGVSIPGRWQ
jgi:pyruvate formate lyase activating enzyme